MTENELKEIRDRWSAATPGPWQLTCAKSVSMNDLADPNLCVWDALHDVQGEPIIALYEHNPVGNGCYMLVSELDSDAISYAPTDIAALLAEVERLRAAQLSPWAEEEIARIRASAAQPPTTADDTDTKET